LLNDKLFNLIQLNKFNLNRRQRSLFLILFLAPCVIYVFAFRIFPLLYSVYLSFNSLNILQSEVASYVGFQNYTNLVHDSRFYNSLKVTLFITIVATTVELILGLIMALLLNRDIKHNKIIRPIILIPMFITPVVVGTIWYILFHDTIGPINYLMSFVGIEHINWFGSTSTSLISIIVSDVWQWSPFIFMILLAALQSIDQGIYEAALVDGSSGLKTFRFITLPMLRNSIIISIILRSMDAFRMFDKVFVMTAGGPGTSTEVLSLYIYKTAFTLYEMGYASALTIVSLILLSLIYLLFNRFLTALS
jgi:multiple sugar transport system permease protein